MENISNLSDSKNQRCPIQQVEITGSKSIFQRLPSSFPIFNLDWGSSHFLESHRKQIPIGKCLTTVTTTRQCGSLLIHLFFRFLQTLQSFSLSVVLLLSQLSFPPYLSLSHYRGKKKKSKANVEFPDWSHSREMRKCSLLYNWEGLGVT